MAHGWTLWAGALVAGLLLVVLVMPVRVELEYHRLPGSWGSGTARLRLLGGLVRLRRRLRLEEQADRLLDQVIGRFRQRRAAAHPPAAAPGQEQRATPDPAEPVRPSMARLKARLKPRLKARLLGFARQAVLPTLQTLDVREARVFVELGTGDAAGTAMATGALWGVLGGAYGFALSHLRRKPPRPRLQVRPNFNAQGWQLRLDFLCIIEARPANIIGALLAVAGRAAIKGGMRRGRPSDSGTDEDGHGEHQGHG